MPKNCEFVFLDKNGNRASDYYSNIEKYGEEEAKLIYLNRTLANTKAKFSKTSGLEELKAADALVRNKKIDRSEYTAVTSIIDDYSSSPNEEAYRAAAIEIKAIDIRDKRAAQNNYIEMSEAIKSAEKFFEDPDNADIVDLYIKEAAQRWKNQAEQGELIHKSLEFVIDEYNAVKKIQDVVEIGKLIKPALDKMTTLFNEEKLSIGVKSEIGNIAFQIFNLKADLEKKYGTVFEILPELNLVGKSVKFKDKKVRGKADIVFISDKKKIAVVVDVKTKNQKSFHNFDSVKYPKMTGPFSDIDGNSENKTAIQTGLYKSILENDYGFNVVSTDVFLITGSLNKTNNDVGNREWKFTNIDTQKTEIRPLRSLKGLVESVFTVTDESNIRSTTVDGIINTLFGSNINALVDNTDSFVEREMQTIKKTVNGRFQWVNELERKTYYATTEVELRALIKKSYTDFIIKKKNASEDLISFFKKGEVKRDSLWSNPAFTGKAMHILNGMTKDSHDVFTSHDLSELRGIGTDVIVFQNKRTKEITLVSISPTYNSKINFHEEGDEDIKTTVLGPFMTDDAVTVKYGMDLVPQADTHNINLIRLGLVAAELKRINPKMFGKIKGLKSVTTSGSYNNYRTSNMAEQLGNIKLLSEVMSINNIDVPILLTNILNDRDLSQASLYKEDYFNNFIELIQELRDPLYGISNADSRLVRKELHSRIKELQENQDDLTADIQLEKALARYVQQVYRMVSLELGTTDKDAIYGNQKYIDANNAYLSFKGINPMHNPRFKGDFMKSMNSAKTLNDPFADDFDKIIFEKEQRVRDTIVPFIDEHNKLIEALMRDLNISKTKRALSIDVYDLVFKDMLKDGFNFSTDRTEDWMRFKDPETDGINLSDNQKAYIRFFNKHIKQASRVNMGKNYKYAYPQEGKSNSWPDGSIPIIPSSSTIDLQETMQMEGGQNIIKLIGKAIRKTYKRTDKNSKTSSLIPWEFNQGFMDQVDGNPGRGSADTRELLGIDDKGNALNVKRNIEKNPAMILNLYMLNAARKEHMQQAAFAYTALDASLVAYQKFNPNFDVGPLRSVLSDLNKIRIHGKYKDEAAIGNILDAINKSASLGLFWGSLRQFSTEASTATVQMTSATLGTVINKYLFSGDNRFNIKDLGWSAANSINSFGEQVITSFGLYNSDLGRFSSNDYVGTRSGSMWQSKWGFWMIQNVLRQSTTAVVLAQMHKDGITNKCFDLVDGVYVYNETLDPRFYVYDPELKIPNQEPKAPTTDLEIQKYLLWKEHRKILAREGGIDTLTGRMKRPMTIENLMSLKNYAIRLFGAMDSSQALAVEIEAMGRSLVKFKKWMRQKIDNYWTPTYKSKKEGRWDFNEEDKKWSFIEEDYEGYINSLVGMVKDIRSMGWTDAKIKMSRRREENITKLLSDMLIFVALYFGVQLLLESELYDDSALAKELIKGTGNAVADVMPAQGLLQIAKSSPMAATSVVTNATSNVIKSLLYATSGDFEKSLERGQRALETLGGVRTVKGIVDTIANNK